MVAAALTFLTPWGALVALVALVPLAALGVAWRRSERAARAVGLSPAPRRALAPAAAALAVAALAAGAACAQPALKTQRHLSIRTQSEILYVVDVSRSMLASRGPAAPTRLAAARSVVRRIHAATADVPSGLAGLTDRVLPYLFPTGDAADFGATLELSVRIEAPPPQQVSRNATSFAALAAVGRNGFFDRSARRRTCVVVTDGETRPYATGDVAGALAGERGCRLVVVRVGGAGDRVRGADGSPEAAYAPDPAAAADAQALASAAGGRAFAAASAGAAADAVRADAEVGPVGARVVQPASRALASWLAALALLSTGVFAAERLRVFRWRKNPSHAYAGRVVSRGVS
jgi:hypothetical protein